MIRVSLAVALLLALTGCAARRPAAAVPQYGLARDHSYIDLQPGWRLRVVTPLLKSGGYRVRASEQQVTPGTGTSVNIQMRADSDFLGYELAYYSLEPKGRVRLSSVEATVEGKVEPRQKPAAKLFAWPGDARFVRLVFLTRASNADHDMAVLTARRYEDLDVWTAKLRAEPESACASTRYCSWVPGGIAVTAEQHNAESGKWVPADGAGGPRRR